ncbi:hypothetical protein SAMN02745146_3446 [Hymenobacter daecheongensis DSM 21074]|uniref:Metalloprotease n=1 Tax=Hymenobacter daecheongensis DSM 21074 TaxID=1121955 RepID=A0A1M6KI52_9BACT|nr:metalloprotease [Hymenobacter daecheongensis]SHJ58646.1 hypothetical protein SAMN02745146_3446 [Hymenobacter daecheongensis DSM 21074]
MKIYIALLLFSFQTNVASAQDDYCYGAEQGKHSIRDLKLYSTSGNYQVDQITIQELSFMSSRFLVYPVLYFYDGENAFASKDQLSPNGPDGTVAFGFQLFNREYIRYPGGPSIPIIIAHEFGHIVQFKYGGFSHISIMKKELFADYLAGAYLLIRGGLNIDAVQESFEEMGDTDFGSLDHHGTPEQRTAALAEGYNDAMREGYRFTLSRAITLGRKYVLSIPDPENEDEVEP